MEMNNIQGVQETKEAVQDALEGIAERREEAMAQEAAQAPQAEQPVGERTPEQVAKEAFEKLAAAQEQEQKEYKEITLKFGKGCVKDTFTAKDGKDYTCILIPNQDKEDKRPWQTFVVRANHVHEDKFGKGMWIKLPAEGHTTLHRNMIVGEGEDGKKIWETQKEKVTNVDLKKMVEAYKTRGQGRDEQQQDRYDRPRESFREKLDEQKIKVVAAQSHAPKQQHNKAKEAAL